MYIIGKANSASPIKIGISANPEKRLKQLQTGSPDRLVLVHTVYAHTKGLASDWEANAHDVFTDRCIAGEWFNIQAEEVIRRSEEWRRDRKRVTNQRTMQHPAGSAEPFHPEIPRDLLNVPISQMPPDDRVRFWAAFELEPPPLGFDDWYIVGTPRLGVIGAFPVKGFICQEPKGGSSGPAARVQV